jgi:hypothetical protein
MAMELTSALTLALRPALPVLALVLLALCTRLHCWILENLQLVLEVAVVVLVR